MFICLSLHCKFCNTEPIQINLIVEMKGHYITDYITSIDHLNQAFEAIFKGSKFDCTPFDDNFSTIGKGIATEDFFIGNFITDNIASIRATNMKDCIISMARLGHFDTHVGNQFVTNRAHESGNILTTVDEVIYDDPSKLVNNYVVIINHQDLLNMMDIKYGVHQLSDYFREIHLVEEKVKALFYYVGSTIHVIETFESLRESLVAKMNIKEITLLMATDLLGDILHKKSLLNESPDKKMVIMAEEIMDSQCENVTTIQEIADKVFTSPRNLQKAFKKYRDYTPLQFLKERKLIRANYILKDPYSKSNIKNVAINVGMFDLNRFSKYYYDKFGEYPSETINRKN